MATFSLVRNMVLTNLFVNARTRAVLALNLKRAGGPRNNSGLYGLDRREVSYGRRSDHDFQRTRPPESKGRSPDPHSDVDPAESSERASSDRPAEPQPELDEVAGADGAVAVEVEGEEVAAEVLAEDDEVAGGDGAVAVDVAVEAEDLLPCVRRRASRRCRRRAGCRSACPLQIALRT